MSLNKSLRTAFAAVEQFSYALPESLVDQKNICLDGTVDDEGNALLIVEIPREDILKVTERMGYTVPVAYKDGKHLHVEDVKIQYSANPAP